MRTGAPTWLQLITTGGSLFLAASRASARFSARVLCERRG